VGRQHAGDVEAEHVVEAAERQPRAEAHAQLDDLLLAVVLGHPLPELVVEVVVVERVALGVLGREPRPLVEEIRGAPVEHRVRELLLDLDAVAFGAPVEAEDAAVDLGDPQPRGLELPQPQRGVRVDRQRELRGGDPDTGHHFAPDVPDRVLALGDVDVHERLLPSLPAAGRSGTSSAS
jgi:hypothetical protein